jgi:hypothetical protein
MNRSSEKIRPLHGATQKQQTQDSNLNNMPHDVLRMEQNVRKEKMEIEEVWYGVGVYVGGEERWFI